MNFQEFIDKTLGKAIDVDGVPTGQKYQCVDLAKYFNILYNGSFQVLCSKTGYAEDWATQKSTNRILEFYTETAVNNMITGTLVVYGKCRVAPLSHIGFFIRDNGNGTFQMLHQNANNCHYVTISNMPYEGIIGAFIPNQLVRKNENVSRETSEVKKEENNVQLYVNIPKTITLRNFYDSNFKHKGVLKPAKFGGLSYKILERTGDYIKIPSVDYGEVYIKYTITLSITDRPLYSHGNY